MHYSNVGSVNRWYKIATVCVLDTENNAKGTAAYWNSCQVSKSRWTSTNLVKNCLNVIWSRRCVLLRKRRMLILEVFKEYLSSAVKNTISKRNTDLVTLGGTMLQLQVLHRVDHSVFIFKMDVGIGSCFKPCKENEGALWHMVLSLD